MIARRLIQVVGTMMIAACIANGALWTPATNAATDDAAVSSPAPSGTPAPACPTREYPAVGALGITDGAVEWFACAPDEVYRTVIGSSDDIVLIEERGRGGRDQRTIAMDAADGSERWRMSTAEAPTPAGPIDGQGIIVLAASEQDATALVGVDAATGQERWRVASGHVPLANSATVAVVGDATSPGASSRFRGIDRVTGDELWVSGTPLVDMSGIFVGRSPAAVLGDVIVVPTGATVTAIDMRTGATLWTAPQLDHLAAADGVVVGTRGTNGPTHLITVAALDAASGQQLWTAPGQPSYGGFLAVGDGVVAILEAERRGVIAYEVSSGSERWRAALTTFVEPQLISGTSLVLLWEGEVSVVSTTDGATIWSATQPFQSPLMNSVGSNGASVFVAINSLPWTN
jgi:outer membrane protein assembly factor BamB